MERKLNDYIASHPEKQAPAEPAVIDKQPQAAKPDADANNPGNDVVADTNAAPADSIMVINASADNN